nr:aminopeptidase P family protein [uncultured Anaerostipes sp.]
MNLNFMKLREQMKNQKVSYYLVPSEDPHQSEYVDDYFKCRQYISGFTGSAGTFLAGCEEGWLWTDGRYFTQAEGQISSDITLMKQGVSGVPTILEFLKEHLQEGDILGVNGFTISASYGKKVAKLVKQLGASFRFDLRFVEELWAKDDRPAITKSTIYRHDIKYSGEHTDSKLARVREKMKELNAGAFFLSSLPDIAWLFNLRGDDIACTPLFYSYAWITMDKCFLFLRKDCISAVAFQRFKEHGISIRDYSEVSSFLKDQHETVLLNPDLTNYLHYNLLFKCKIIEDKNPTELMKAIKNDIQIDHLKACHINDGIAMTKFMYWLKKNVGKIPMTERMISDRLEEEREKQPDYSGPSFETICAYKDHAAMMHYQSTEESDVDVKAEGMLLIDSGGQYYGGTTDVTRTFILGPISEEERKYFTLVLKSMLTLANAKFLFGCRGSNLDILAREPLWEDGIDYRCGTGHGVGYFLGVHEGPNAFRWRSNPENLDAVLQPGMVITDEPGVYVPGKYGIRTENMLICKKWQQNEYGTFLHFEPLTLVPIDLDGVDLSLFNEKEKQLLTDYQQFVYDTLSPHLNEEESAWLHTLTL